MSAKFSMLSIFAATLLGAAGAVGIGHYLGSGAAPNNNANLEARLARLEQRLNDEQVAREELMELIAQQSAVAPRINRGLSVQQVSEQDIDLSVEDDRPLAPPEVLTPTQAENQISEPLSIAEYRMQALVAGGFAEDEAAWVADNEAQVELEQLYSQHQLQRQALAEDSLESRSWQQRQRRADRLREKLGDDYYERYLKANGWPTAAQVQSVIKGSPADKSGLQPGDRITSYAGQKVFNMRDVSRLTLQGEEGESVLLEVERNGNPIQITIPRGPVGVSSRNNRFGR